MKVMLLPWPKLFKKLEKVDKSELQLLSKGIFQCIYIVIIDLALAMYQMPASSLVLLEMNLS